MCRERMSVGVSRRVVLQAGLVGLCSCLAPWRVLAAPPTFYTVHKDQFVADFAGVCAGAEKWLAVKGSGQAAQAIAADAKRRFEALLTAMPDIGGQANRNLPFLVMAGWLTALYQAMREKGFVARDAGRLLYDLNATDWSALPRQRAQAMGAVLFSPPYRDELEKWAANSQKRQYPGDWVGRVVPGDGKNFDLGYDYTECGAVKFFKAQGVPEVAPYYCLNDFLAAKAQDTGLVRHGTLAQGDALCDFRYKRGRPVTQNWETELPRVEGKKPA